uniref:Nmad5 family putative nucleotide modification protein n=1 Tax=Xenorhabdus sp. GDc328 TaxID=742178 RepID=UPI0006C682EB
PMLRIDAFPIYESSYIEINLAGISVLAFYNGSLRYSQREYRERVFKITPKVKNVILADNPLVNEFYELEKRHNELENQRRDITNNVEAALAKVRTVKRLLTEWPEAEELLPKSTAKAAPVPAVRRDALNEMIGLPTEVVG